MLKAIDEKIDVQMLHDNKNSGQTLGLQRALQKQALQPHQDQA